MPWGTVSSSRSAVTPKTAQRWLYSQWRRSVVKWGGRGQSGQAIKLFQVPRKLVLPSIFDTRLLRWWCETCSYPATVLNEKCDILGGQNIRLTPPTYFQGSRPPTPMIYAPIYVYSHVNADTASVETRSVPRSPYLSLLLLSIRLRCNCTTVRSVVDAVRSQPITWNNCLWPISCHSRARSGTTPKTGVFDAFGQLLVWSNSCFGLRFSV